LVTILPEDPESQIYHTLNLTSVEAVAEALDLEWFSEAARKHEEVEALDRVLKRVDAEVLVTGGIASIFQKRIFESAASRLGLESYAPLWGWSAQKEFSQLLTRRFKIMVVGVAALGLGKEWLGHVLTGETIKRMLKLSEQFRFNPLGEGGDFETFVLDAPLYRKALKVIDGEQMWLGDRGHYIIGKTDFEGKDSWS
jgi:predicted ATP pyrophosphatase (TIGR00289 family)